MSLKLPNYPREFIDAYVKFMTIQYIKGTIRESILDFIKDEYKRYLKRTFGTASELLINHLILEVYRKEDYYFKITDYIAKQGQDIENYIKEIIGTKNKHLLNNVREGKFSDYKQEEWYKGFVLFVDKLITKRSRNIKELICELKFEEITNLVDYLSELILIHPKTMEAYVNGKNKKNPRSFERLKRLYNLTQDIELENKKEKINTFIVKNFINPDNKGLLVCPYCNRNYINDREPFLGAEMDHFYSKDKYPMFAVSLYNFIPSCSTCNRIKKDHDLKINPFLKENKSNIKFDLIKNIGNGYKIALICESLDKKEKDNFINDIYDVLKLDKAYQVHSIDIEEMVNREVEYGLEQRKLLESIFSETEGELDKKIDALIYGDIIFKSEDELINISLGKLKKDAYEKIKDWKNSDSNVLK